MHTYSFLRRLPVHNFEPAGVIPQALKLTNAFWPILPCYQKQRCA
jgi:hypothetical protein